jgi:hypothetical protein
MNSETTRLNRSTKVGGHRYKQLADRMHSFPKTPNMDMKRNAESI